MILLLIKRSNQKIKMIILIEISFKKWILKSNGQHNSHNHHYQLWQQHNHPILLEKNEHIDKALDYIHQNPVKAGFVDEAEDWVIATGKTTTVRDFVKMCFSHIGIEIEFKEEGASEKGYVKICNNPEYKIEIGKEVVAVDEKYYRPTEVDLLIGDASKARKKLGWEPEYNLQDLIDDMMSFDIKLMKKEQYLKDGGYTIKNYFE